MRWGNLGLLPCALPPPVLDPAELGSLPAAPKEQGMLWSTRGLSPPPPWLLRDSSKPEDTIHPALGPLKLGQAPPPYIRCPLV